MSSADTNTQLCYQCGKCVSTCPMNRREFKYNDRKLIQFFNLGFKEEAMNDPYLWCCTTCYTCQEGCPQKVGVVDGILHIRTLAVKEGIMLDPHRAVAQNVYKYGMAVPIDEKNMKKRESVGLDGMAPNTQKFDKSLDEVKKLIELSGFDKLIEKRPKKKGEAANE
ncbi:MAG: CoB--CoM heterodisulfide reductase subunit C [Methanosarcinaceae archaeon]|nr:CoB--CoM heterodisulfide reductase subunit C [Methanosarcinaceae archaeon]